MSGTKGLDMKIRHINQLTENIEIFSAICQSEVEKLQQNLSQFFTDKENYRRQIESGDNINTKLLLLDARITMLTDIKKHAVEFNKCFQLNKMKNELVSLPQLKYAERAIQAFDEFNIGKYTDLIKDAASQLESIKDIDLTNSDLVSGGTVNFNCSLNIRKETDGKEHIAQPSKPNVIESNLSSFTNGYEFLGLITYVEDEENLIFYVSTAQSKELLQLHLCSEQRSDRYLPPNYIFGISHDDGKIMRAVWRPGNGVDKALLIDTGEVLPLLKYCKLYDIPEKYRNVPPEAIKCSLLGINCDGDKNGNLTNALRLNLNKKVKFKVIGCKDNILQLRILENHLVEESKFEKESTNCVEKLTDADADVPLATLEAVNNLEFEGPPTKSSYGKENWDWNSKSITAAPLSTVQTVANLNSIKTDATDNGVQSANVVVQTISVTHIKDVKSFYGLLDNYQSEPPPFWSVDELPAEWRLSDVPQLDDVVLSLYNDGDFWYRAKVIGIDDAKCLLEVFYVDYGNTEIVPLTHLAYCFLSQEEQPYCAKLCHIVDVSDVTGSNEQSRQNAVDILALTLLNKKLNVLVLKQCEDTLYVRFIEDEVLESLKVLEAIGCITMAGSS